jgi:hypothetical protein
MTWRLIYQAEYNKAMGIDPRNQIPKEDGTLSPAKEDAAKPAAAPAQADPVAK